MKSKKYILFGLPILIILITFLFISIKENSNEHKKNNKITEFKKEIPSNSQPDKSTLTSVKTDEVNLLNTKEKQHKKETSIKLKYLLKNQLLHHPKL
jgi:hypothetical protein